MKCPICDGENKEGMVFCGKCGSRLPKVSEQPSAPVQPSVDNAQAPTPVAPVQSAVTPTPVQPSVVNTQPVQQVVNTQPTTPVVPQPVQPTLQVTPATSGIMNMPQAQQVNTPPIQPNVPGQVPPQQHGSGLSNGQKGIIVGLLAVVLVLLGVAIFFKGNNKQAKTKKEDTRTIMIYLDGNNLESQSGIATAELKAIDPNRVDLDKTNIIVYTGGTKKWHNFVKNDENAIYKLTKDGFVKLETYKQQDMGNYQTLLQFLNYGYENYKAGHMDLVLFDHGAAILGAMEDERTGNLISLEGFKKALTESPFKGDNKFELIAFRTCLNGTIENASIFADHAEYMVASEEITYGAPTTNVFGYFINDLPPSADGMEVGQKFIKAYDSNVGDICRQPGEILITYAIIDLSKVNKLITELERYVGGINVKEGYATLSRVRKDLYTFGVDDRLGYSDFDTVDLYELVNQTQLISTVSPDNFNKAFDEAIAYYYTNNKKDTHGLSVYFPYQASKDVRSYMLKEYSSLGSFSSYKNFISSFNDLKNGDSPKSFSFSNSVTKYDDTREVTLTLSDDQKDNYVGAKYAVLRRDEKHPNYYEFIYITNDVDKSEEGKIKTKMSDKLIKVMTSDGKSMYLGINDYVNGSVRTRTVGAITYRKGEGEELGTTQNVDIFINDTNDGRPELGDAKIARSRDLRIDGVVRPLSDFSSITFIRSRYKILDKNGKIMSTEDWESTPDIEGYEFSKFKSENVNDEIELRYSGFDDGEFYVLFIVYDMNNQGHLYDLIKVGA